MSFWAFVALAIAIFAIVEIINKVSQASQAVRIARIEADLKRDLVDRLGDPNLVARVVEAKFSGQDALVPGDGKSLQAKVVMQGVEPSPAPQGSGILFSGLVLSCVGGAFLVLAGMQDNDFAIPGVLCLACGLAFLVYPTARDELARARSQAQTQARAARSGE
ncbi:MAG: hypothetical protein H6834_01110 [Planctomycetes bacterium]|nr:hypothetical protein [Planctomycetota bacterium]